MKFQIERLKIDDEQLALSTPLDDKNNVYTLLVGKNACGKTRVLSKLTNIYLFDNQNKSLLSDGVDECFNSLSSPRKVIAISNSRFDRFPKPGNYDKKYPLTTNYNYLGISGLHSSVTPLFSEIIPAIISQTENSTTSTDQLIQIFDYIGFLPFLQLELRIKEFSLSRESTVTQTQFKHFKKSKASHLYDFNFHIIKGLEALKKYSDRKSTISLRYDFFSKWSDFGVTPELSQHLKVLLDSGFLEVTKLSLIQKNNKNIVNFHHASSGQQCMLLMFLGLASVMENSSLICIDEPEISLHPRWQADFIGMLQKIFSEYKGCHFVIATHSPQLVSGLISSNGFVLDLETSTLLRPKEYAKKSADYQLTEIFHEPGFKNEYLIRILLLMISRLSKGEELSNEDKDRIEAVEYVKTRLDATDPVLHLYNQVIMLVN